MHQTRSLHYQLRKAGVDGRWVAKQESRPRCDSRAVSGGRDLDPTSTPCGNRRQENRKSGATAETAVDSNPASMRLYDVSGNRQPEAGSGHPVVRFVTPKKLLEDASLIFARNAHASIYYGDGHLSTAPTQLHANPAAATRVLHRVVEQIDENVCHCGRVDANQRQLLGRSHGYREAFLRAAGVDRRHGGPHDVLDRHQVGAIAHSGRLDATEAQCVVDKVPQSGALPLDAARVLDDLVHRRDPPEPQEFREYSDRRQGRTEIMRDAGYEPVADSRESSLAPRRPPREEHTHDCER